MSSIPRFRHFGDEAPRYGAKNDFFTLEVHHGGKLFDKPNNVVYEHEYVMFVDFVLPQHFTRGMLNKFCDACGSGGEMTFYYKKRGLSLEKGLVRLKSEADVREMLRDRNGQRFVQIYVVGPQASLSLAMEAFEEHDDGNRCDMLLNNLCESFNSTILGAREKPILTMLEEIRMYLMKRIVARREACEKWHGDVGPRIQKILEKNGKLARSEYADYYGQMKFQVRHNAGNILHAVDISAKTCTCRGWQLTGIPCCHVIAALHSCGMTMMDYVDDIYKRDAYHWTYIPSISPITGSQAWPNPGLNPLTPPYYTKKAGRPKKSKRKEAGEQNTSTPTPEAAANATPSTSGNLSRKGLTMRCKKCDQAGHNKRSCKGAPSPATNM